MTKIRIIIFLITILVVSFLGTFVSLYARGYRLNTTTLKFSPNGLLVIKSVPDGAQIFINGELKTATNATIALGPATYDVGVRKEGFRQWEKRLEIQKEIVTEETAYLFKATPSFSAVTFSGIINPISSNDMTKLSYLVAPSPNSQTGQEGAEGLWIMETINLPLGFLRQPRRVTDGDLTKADWTWSPDGREILLNTQNGSFLLNSGTFTAQAQRVNVANEKNQILESWQKQEKIKQEAQLRRLPDELVDVLKRKASAVIFSPDEEVILYIASGSATLSSNLIKPMPGSSTQKQERNIKLNQTYTYSIKEDRNFLIDEDSSNLTIEASSSTTAKRRLTWFPTSRHLVLAEEEKITIMDFDGTNRQVIYSGSYIAPNAFPTLSPDRLLILTSLGASSVAPNLYSLSLK